MTSSALKRIGMALLAAAAAAAPSAGAGEANLHFLDRNSGEARRALQDLARKAEASPTPDALADLGWARLLYGGPVREARAGFRAALEKDPSHLRSLEGLLAAESWIGDDAAAGAAMLDLVARAPGSPAALVLARNADPLPYWHHGAGDRARAFREAMGKAPPELRWWLALDVAGHDWAAGREEEAFALWLSAGNVPRWRVLGWIGDGGAACFDETLEPERDLDLGRTFRAGVADVSWRRIELTPWDADPGEAAGRILKGQGSCLLLLAFLRVPERTPVAIRTALSVSHKVFVNGRAAGVADRFAETPSLTLAFPALLRKGWNRLLLKVEGSGARGRWLSSSPLTVTRPDFGPVEGLEFPAEDPPPEALTAEPEEGEAPALPPTGLEALRASFADAARRTVPEALWLAGLCKEEGLPDEAREVWRVLAGAHGACPLVRWAAARFDEGDSGLYTPDERRGRAQAGYEEALQAGPDFFPARLSLGDLFSSKDRDKALDAFLGALAERPDSFQARRGLIAVYRAQGWDAEAYLELLEQDRLHGGRSGTHADWESWYEDLGNGRERLRRAERSMEADGLRREGRLLGAWETLGLRDRVAQYWRKTAARRPADPNAWTALAGACLRISRTEEAREAARRALALDPESGEATEALARIEAEAGDLEAYKKVLLARLAAPARAGLYDHRAREAVERMEGRDGAASG
ncbi:MAG: tetratricopeptide repeat protein, partial [Planctomycetes bacterium]|nr:tetratricopeptide repeat protein [Planctomycetota bacterium]